MPQLRELLAERSRLNGDPERNAVQLERLEKRIAECQDRFWRVEPGDVIRGHKLALPRGVTAGLDPEDRDD